MAEVPRPRRVRPAARAGRIRAGVGPEGRPARGHQDRDASWPARAASSATSPSGTAWRLADTQRRVHSRGGQKKVDFYLRLHALGIFPADAPATIRAFGMAQGQLTVEELVDRYRLQCKPVRDLLVDYLKERQPALDYASLRLDLTRPWPACSGPGSRPCPRASPRCGCRRTSPARGRKTCRRSSAASPAPTGSKTVVTRPRINAKDELIRVRALYLDIAQWAMEEPGRWAQWAVPSPVSDAEINWAKERRRRKARMDQRTRERLPVLPVLARTAADRKNATARHLQAAIDDTARRDHRGHRRDTAPGRRAQGQRAARVGRGHRHRQAPQPVL